ncbi:hypothetical protein, partial [Escherichia coli]|uniref:hypothetical protein n=1 Tax=Escherichia coli TaxID=562 RepID=UPI0028FC4996
SGDANAATVDLISTRDPGQGAADLIFGNNGEDILIGGFGSDRIYKHQCDCRCFGYALLAMHFGLELTLSPTRLSRTYTFLVSG